MAWTATGPLPCLRLTSDVMTAGGLAEAAWMGLRLRLGDGDRRGAVLLQQDLEVQGDQGVILDDQHVTHDNRPFRRVL